MWKICRKFVFTAGSSWTCRMQHVNWVTSGYIHVLRCCISIRWRRMLWRQPRRYIWGFWCTFSAAYDTKLHTHETTTKSWNKWHLWSDWNDKTFSLLFILTHDREWRRKVKGQQESRFSFSDLDLASALPLMFLMARLSGITNPLATTSLSWTGKGIYLEKNLIKFYCNIVLSRCCGKPNICCPNSCVILEILSMSTFTRTFAFISTFLSLQMSN